MMENTQVQTQRQDLQAHTAGDPAGPLTIYFHGAPGAPSELAIFEAPARACGLKLMCWDRFALDAALTGPAYFAALAAAVRAVAGAQQVNLIGFSIGAFIALRISQMLGLGTWTLPLLMVALLFVVLYVSSRRLGIGWRVNLVSYLMVSSMFAVIVFLDA